MSRGLHFLMSDSQQRRLEAAMDILRQAPGSFHPSAFVNVADAIPIQRESAVLKGHGTQQADGQLVASVCGIIERVDQLVSVRPLRARYNAETGDVVVGRVTEVGMKKWKVDINSKHDVQLMLSAVNLPGGIQRRRTAIDELNMRTLYEENDLISAEVQSVHTDGTVHLHTRSLKYGKLERGQVVVVPPYLVKRLKQHFHSLTQYGVDMIIGCNGYIWISAAAANKDEDGVEHLTGTDMKIDEGKEDMIPMSVRENICRLSNSVRVLGFVGFLIHPEIIIDTYEASISWAVDIKDMLGSEFYVRIAEREAGRRTRKHGF